MGESKLPAKVFIKVNYFFNWNETLEIIYNTLASWCWQIFSSSYKMFLTFWLHSWCFSKIWSMALLMLRWA